MHITLRLELAVVLVLTSCGDNHDRMPDASPDAAELAAFAFSVADNPGLTHDVTATITGTAITATIPFGEGAAPALIPTFVTTGSAVTVAGMPQVSGTTTNDFTTPLHYLVTAASGATQDYTVTIATPSFAPEVTFATGTSPIAIAVADFNGDSRPDLAITNNGSGTTSVLLDTTATGAAAPDFATHVDLASTSPFGVAAGDLDGDGKPDIVVTNNSADTATLFINTTAAGATIASFATGTDLATQMGPTSVAIGDLNADGKPDVAIANVNSNTISVYLNTTTTPGTPTFGTRVDLGRVHADHGRHG